MAVSKALRGTVQDIDGDYVISIPDAVRDRLDLMDGQELEVFILNDSLIARPLTA